MTAIIIAETENFTNFSSTEQVLTYDESESSVYQSEQMPSTHAKMVKRSSKHLRYVLFNANKYICHGTTTLEPIFLKTCGKQCV